MKFQYLLNFFLRYKKPNIILTLYHTRVIIVQGSTWTKFLSPLEFLVNVIAMPYRFEVEWMGSTRVHWYPITKLCVVVRALILNSTYLVDADCFQILSLNVGQTGVTIIKLQFLQKNWKKIYYNKKRMGINYYYYVIS